MHIATAQEIQGCGIIAKRSSTAKGTREVRGFVSTTNLDRHDDMIDPLLFDTKTFLKNPQILVDHMPWINPSGNGISVGRVSFAQAAKAVAKEDGSFDIISIENDEVIDHVPAHEADIVENGMKGLWATCEVMEPDVIKLVDDGRLNAFSWRGDLVETRFGKHIDLMEVSLVFIPANSKALFMITKSAIRKFSYDADGTKVAEIKEPVQYDEDTIRKALECLNDNTFGEKAKPLILAAARALGIEVNKAVEDTAVNSTAEVHVEGGDEDMALNEEDAKAIGESVATAFRSEFEKFTAEMKSAVTKEPETVVAKSETPPPAETVVEVKKEVEQPDIKELIANAVKEALEPLANISKRIDELTEKPVVETNQPNEMTKSIETEAKKKNPLELLGNIKDPVEKKQAKLTLLNLAMFGPESLPAKS